MNHYPKNLYWVRRALFYYILYDIIGLQLDFILFRFFGVRYDPNLGIFLAPFGFPITMAAISMAIEFKTNKDPECLVDWKIWGLIAPIMFVLWAIGYMMIGHLADHSMARVLNSTFDRFIPFDHYWVFFYLSVYPLFLLPYFYVKSGRGLITLTFGYFIMLTISYTIFVVMPVVMYTRPVLQTTDFSSWCMNAVYGQDPLWNCMPSTHCGVAILSAVALFRDNRKFGIWAILTALIIGASTLFTKQHYIVDMLAGYTLGLLVYWTVYRIIEPKIPKKIPMPKSLHVDDVDIS